jgi:succinoglycan biosynthesis transport protein ExoP
VIGRAGFVSTQHAEVIVMELKDYLQALRRWLWLIGLGVVTAIASSYLAFRYLALWPVYEATTTIAIRADDTINSIVMETKRATYVELAQSEQIAEAVVRELALPLPADELVRQIHVESEGQSQLIKISARYDDPRLAAAIANEIARQLSYVSLPSQRMPSRYSDIMIITPALIPTHLSLSSYLAPLVAGAMGLILTSGIVILIESLDRRIRTFDDVARSLHLPVLGTLIQRHPYYAAYKNSQPTPGVKAAEEIPVADGTLPAAIFEACRWVRVNISHMLDEHLESLLITSPEPLASTSLLGLGLAKAWEETGQEGVFIDVHSCQLASYCWFGSSHNGKSRFVIGRADEPFESADDGAAAPAQVQNGLPHPISSQELQELEVVIRLSPLSIIHGPPVFPTADAAILASKVNGVVLVVQSGKSRVQTVQQAIEALTHSGGRVLGVVLVP